MNVYHPNAQFSSDPDSPGYGIRYVMKFEIEKDIKSHIDHAPDKSGPAAVKSSLPIFTLQLAGSSPDKNCSAAAAVGKSRAIIILFSVK